MKDYLKRIFLDIIYRISLFIGELHMPFSHKKIGSYDYRKLRTVIRPGDIILSRTSGELSNFFIPGFFKHAAIYYGFDGLIPEIIESVKVGVRKADLLDFALKKDYLAVIRPHVCERGKRQAILAQAKNLIGAKYDFEFNLNNRSFYCAELIFHLFYDEKERQSYKDNATVMPQDFFDDKQKFKVVWLSDSSVKELNNE